MNITIPGLTVPKIAGPRGTVATGTAPAPGATSGVAAAIPGFTGLTNTATGNIMQLLNGLPSASYARTTNAYEGVGSGQPATGGIGSFEENRGADLYHQQSQQYQQQGLQDLLSMISGYSGTVAPSAGQELQNNTSLAQLQNNENQFAQNQNLDWYKLLGINNNAPQPQKLGINNVQPQNGEWGTVRAGTGSFLPWV